MNFEFYIDRREPLIKTLVQHIFQNALAYFCYREKKNGSIHEPAGVATRQKNLVMQ